MKRLSLALAALLAVGGAQAATVSFQYGIPLVESTTEINQTGLLGLFNTAQGTLTGASLEIFGSATTTITLTNIGTTTQTGRATASVDLDFSSSLAPLSALLTTDIGLTFTTGAALTYTPGQSRSFGPLTDSDSVVYDLSGILGSLQGGGTFGLTCTSVSGISIIGGGGNLRADQRTAAGCGARIVYTFTPPPPPPPPGVPEPASLALVGLALAGASVASRRRRQG